MGGQIEGQISRRARRGEVVGKARDEEWLRRGKDSLMKEVTPESGVGHCQAARARSLNE